MYDLVVIGSPSLDRVVGNSSPSHELIFSGPAIMTALTAARLDIEHMVLVGSISPRDSSHLSEVLDTLNIPENFKIESHETGGFEIEYNGSAEPTITKILGIPKQIGIRDIPDEFLSSRFIVLSPLLHEIGAELVEWICDSSDATILMDPQLRTSGDGQGITTLTEMELVSKTTCYLDFIKPNQEEASFLTGVEDPFVAAEILVDTLAENCIITRDVNGSIFFDGTDFKIIPSFRVDPIDNLGAGAAFLGGFVSGLLSDSSYDYCAALGNSVASFKVAGHHTNFLLDKHNVIDRANEISLNIKTH